MEMGGINNLNLETLGMLFSNIKKIHYNLKMVPFEKKFSSTFSSSSWLCGTCHWTEGKNGEEKLKKSYDFKNPI